MAGRSLDYLIRPRQRRVDDAVPVLRDAQALDPTRWAVQEDLERALTRRVVRPRLRPATIGPGESLMSRALSLELLILVVFAGVVVVGVVMARKGKLPVFAAGLARRAAARRRSDWRPSGIPLSSRPRSWWRF